MRIIPHSRFSNLELPLSRTRMIHRVPLYTSEHTQADFALVFAREMARRDEYGKRLVEETRHLVATTKGRIVSARKTDPLDPEHIERLKEVLQTQEELLMKFELVLITSGQSSRCGSCSTSQ